MNEIVGRNAGNAIGIHAVSFYLLGLGILLLVSALSYYLNSRQGQGSRRFPRYLPFSIIVCCITGFAVIATAIAHMETITFFDEALSSSITLNLAYGALHFFAWITHAGDTLTYTLLCIATACAMLLRRHYLLAIATILTIGGNAILNRTLKAIFERVRPVQEHGLIVADGWSFPSGHSSGAVVTYGIMAYLLLRLTPRQWHVFILLATVSLVFTIGSSRVFLQVHYLSDVIAGFLSGLCWLTLCIWCIRLKEQGHKTCWVHRS